MKFYERYRVRLLALLSLLLTLDLQAADSLNKADSLYRAGRFDSAVSLLKNETLPEFEARRDTISLLKAWSILGCCYVEKGEHELAAKYCNLSIKALDYYGEDFFYVTNTLYNIAQMYHRLGYYEEALSYIDRSIIYENELGRNNIIARRYIEKATILMDMGDYEGALDVLENALPFAAGLVNTHFQSQIIYLKGLCYEEIGNADAANDMFLLSDESAHYYYYGSGYNYQGIGYTLVPGLSLKIGDYSLAEGDTASAVKMYMLSVKNARHVREYDTESKALEALAGIFEVSDPELSAEYLARADSLTFSPYVSELALKMALVGIEFPRREREQQIKIQSMRIIMLALIAAFLGILTLLLWYKSISSQRVAEMERERSEMLERTLEQKQRLLALAESASDRALSQKVKQIASNLSEDILTKREREISAMISQGLLNKEIADKLNISLRTVQNHRNAIYRKLGVTNTAELIKVIEGASASNHD